MLSSWASAAGRRKCAAVATAAAHKDGKNRPDCSPGPSIQSQGARLSLTCPEEPLAACTEAHCNAGKKRSISTHSSSATTSTSTSAKGHSLNNASPTMGRRRSRAASCRATICRLRFPMQLCGLHLPHHLHRPRSVNLTGCTLLHEVPSGLKLRDSRASASRLQARRALAVPAAPLPPPSKASCALEQGLLSASLRTSQMPMGVQIIILEVR